SGSRPVRRSPAWPIDTGRPPAASCDSARSPPPPAADRTAPSRPPRTPRARAPASPRSPPTTNPPRTALAPAPGPPDPVACAGRLVVRECPPRWSRQDQPPEDFIQRGLRRFAHSAMDGRHLNDRAARRHQPLEALSARQPGDGSRARIAGADLGEGFQILPDY